MTDALEIDAQKQASTHNILRWVFTRLAQEAGLAWVDETEKYGMPYCKLLNRKRKVSIASAAYLGQYIYEIYGPTEALYATTDSYEDFVKGFGRSVRRLITYQFDAQPLTIITQKHKKFKCKQKQKQTTFYHAALYKRIVTFKDVSDKPINYVSVEDAIRDCEIVGTSVMRYYP